MMSSSVERPAILTTLKIAHVGDYVTACGGHCDEKYNSRDLAQWVYCISDGYLEVSVTPVTELRAPVRITT